MSRLDRRPPAGAADGAGCPSWCRGCGESSPLHRSDLVTVGREGTGWMSVQLIADRFAGRGPRLRVDTTRYGTTQTALLSETHASRLIVALSRGRDVMAGAGVSGVGEVVDPPAGWPYRRVDRLSAGCRILIFGGVVDLLGVDLVPTFPTARLMHVRAVSTGQDFAVVVPEDFCPLVVDR